MNYKEYENKTKYGIEAEAFVDGILRGGTLVENGTKFAYCSASFNITDNFKLVKTF